MSMIQHGARRPLPQHKPDTKPSSNGVIEYNLNPAELEFARANRPDLIATAAQRGLTAPPVQLREFKEPKVEPRKGPASPEVAKSITLKMLAAAIDSGMTNKEIGAMYGISGSTVSVLMKKHGLGSQKGVARKHKKGRDS